MNASPPPITADDLKKSGWEEALEGARQKEAHAFNTAFSTAAKRMEEAGEVVKARSLRYLAALCSMHFKLDDPSAPFGPMVIFGDGSRTMLPKDLTDEEVTAIQELYPSVGDPELRARLADVLWLGIRDYRAAEVAVQAYLESANRLENPDSWVSGCNRIERAFQLARALNNKKLIEETVRHIEGLLDKYKGEDPKFLSAKLMGLLLSFRRGDAEKYSGFAERAANRAEDQKEWHRAENYWTIAAQWRRITGDAEGERRFRELAAETFVKAADAVPSAMVAGAHLESAIEAYRRLGNKARAKELHERLIETQNKAIGEMKAVSTEINLSESSRKARELVKGKNLLEAILALSMIAQIPFVKELRQLVEWIAKEHPIQYLFHMVVFSEEGKKVASRPSMLSDDAEEREEAVRAEMYRQATLYQQTSAVGIIEPARDQILLEHNPRIEDLLPLLTSNSFVPPGRERLYAKGFYHGVHGDFIAAIHILVPQLENSFRYVLRNHGVVVSGLNAKGVQEQYDLGVLLQMKEFEEIFGEDLTFDLKGLLISRFGTNLRNRLAHGLLEDGFFQAASSIYLWWISLFLCCAPTVSRIKRAGPVAGKAPEEVEEKDGYDTE